ncbi:hypothetical protein L1987_39527 [Smallanthus sonchifolius]|uniref:Uncharacterized protein n=1 Tax=Smallanthus sonchifolius TaxID=185202 RepID=A0ACB9HNL7_9ASTR|nr:hypothetical protein L1987_39527 [Smallanthus sonchifolius]
MRYTHRFTVKGRSRGGRTCSTISAQCPLNSAQNLSHEARLRNSCSSTSSKSSELGTLEGSSSLSDTARGGNGYSVTCLETSIKYDDMAMIL